MVKILLVEDNPLTAKGLEYLLEREKYQVAVARDARSARQLLTDNFDLVLLDVGLPDGDGVPTSQAAPKCASSEECRFSAGEEGGGTNSNYFLDSEGPRRGYRAWPRARCG